MITTRKRILFLALSFVSIAFVGGIVYWRQSVEKKTRASGSNYWIIDQKEIAHLENLSAQGDVSATYRLLNHYRATDGKLGKTPIYQERFNRQRNGEIAVTSEQGAANSERVPATTKK